MTLDQAYQILGVEKTASETERHAAFKQKQQALEDKISKAPTPGLKEKYRKALQQLEEAIELVEVSADGGLLPVLEPEHNSKADSGAGLTAEKTEAAEGGKEVKSIAKKSAKKVKQSFGKEIAVMVAVCLLMAGAAFWWFGVEKPKQALAEYNQLTEQIYETGLDASDNELRDLDTRVRAYAQKSSSKFTNAINVFWQDHMRAVDDARAELQAVQDAQETQVTKDLNTLRLAVDQLAGMVDEEEAKLGDLKSAERDSARAKDASSLRKEYDRMRRSKQEDFYKALSNYERSHPMKLAVKTAEDFVDSDKWEAASNSMEGLVDVTSQASEVVAEKRHETFGRPMFYWAFKLGEDSPAFDWLRSDEANSHSYYISYLREKLAYLDRGESPNDFVLITLKMLRYLTGETAADYQRWLKAISKKRTLSSEPSGSSVYVNGKYFGKTPVVLMAVPERSYEITRKYDRYRDHTIKFSPTLKSKVEAEVFAKLEPKQVCPSCRGQGNLAQYKKVDCSKCDGDGRVDCEHFWHLHRTDESRTFDCDNCNGNGRFMHRLQGREVECSPCKGSGKAPCLQCGSSTGGYNRYKCGTCNGSGKQQASDTPLHCSKCDGSGLF